MYKLILCTLLLGVTSTFSICDATELSNSNEIEEGKKFLLETSEKLFKFYDNLRDEQFNDNEELIFDQSQSILNESILLIDIVNQAKMFDYKNFQDNELKYAFEEIVKIADLMIIGGEQYNEIVDALDDLEEILLHENYFYAEKCDENINYDDFDILPSDWRIPETIRAKSNNSMEIQYYWGQVRKSSGKWAKENMDLILEGLRDAANLTDLSPLQFWLREYNLTEMENLMNDIQPLYNELHAFIRTDLQKKYGNSIIKSDGLIPHHLFEQVIAQVWKNGSIIEELFPYEDLPPVDYVLDRNFSPYDLYEYAAGYYEELGFTKFPSKIWGEDIIIQRNGDPYGCKADVYYSSPNVHLEFCVIRNLGQFLDAYSDMAKLYYAKEMTGLPAYYFATHDLEHAIGKAIILSASNYQSLKNNQMILNFNITDAVEMNRLMRKSIESLLNIVTDFVHVKLMADLVSGNVELKDLNKKYWELMDKYAGVESSRIDKTDSEVTDIPASFYQDMKDNTQSRKFDAEIFSYQMHKNFCELSGKYPKEPLHLCDNFGSKAVGDVLKKTMQLGTSKPFNETLAIMFPEDQRISANSILEYYSPVKKLVVEKNLEDNVKPGWKHTEEDTSVEASYDSSHICKYKN
ncbi:angiotensin-converting enzyme-like [Episyrphus balteatus]|uniref:angiotensin-converting enzyme-like n=1 Tax=Episyrphus balteatus TaxID=286459 RepID=UPI00248513B7|nr:angiotensin-converting enzyme-like [Episyrphus balteatus]